jgi:hypothetical protein
VEGGNFREKKRPMAVEEMGKPLASPRSFFVYGNSAL